MEKIVKAVLLISVAIATIVLILKCFSPECSEEE